MKIIDKINRHSRSASSSISSTPNSSAPPSPSSTNRNKPSRPTTTNSDSKNSNSKPSTPNSSSSSPYYSFEFFPPKTEPGLENLYHRITKMSSYSSPLFVDITWGSSGSTSSQTLKIAEFCTNELNLNVLMHLTCNGLGISDLRGALTAAKAIGVRNILALRGDQPHKGKGEWTTHQGE